MGCCVGGDGVDANFAGFRLSGAKEGQGLVVSDTFNNDQDCPRCGALLPDPEEGVCEGCGYEYGRETLYMPVVKLDDEGKVAIGQAEKEAAPPSAGASSAPLPSLPQAPSEEGSKKLWVALGVLIFLFVAVVIAIAALMFMP